MILLTTARQYFNNIVILILRVTIISITFPIINIS